MKLNARSYETDQADGLHGEQERLFVQTINHLRHDWMNDVQVLYGYLKLKKYDKMRDYMEALKERMSRESGIAKLGIPALIVYLQSFRVRSRSIRLDVEPEPGLQLASLPVQAQLVTDAIICVLEAFVRHAGMRSDGEPNELLLKLELRDQMLVIGFGYVGSYNGPGLKQELNELALSYNADERVRGTASYEEDGAFIDIYVPLGE
ncbi:Spo0B domain-containing protein [Paenibacillus hodogayensis]|uniref:Spo0B domain-containing protein n=1 Tax=Paenibacillus hodogayensis TaxID=279208 RepID=A0ABV5VWT2_9BACL